jgi:hypothetical protein
MDEKIEKKQKKQSRQLEKPETRGILITCRASQV